MEGNGVSYLSIIFLIIGVYLLLLLFMYLFQSKLIFLPSSDFIITPKKAGLQAEDVWIETEDGERLHGWFFPNDASEYVVVLSHGNAGNISNRIDIAKFLNEHGLAVLIYDYRGYGQSSGQPDEKGLYLDIEAVIHYLKTEKKLSEEQMIMYGRSMGGAVASYAATKFNISGLVIDSSFKNLKTMISELYPFVPVVLAKYEFPNELYLREIVGIPAMIMHSPNDKLVDISHGKYLYQILAEPKKFVKLRGNHNDSFHASVDIYNEHWKEFLQLVDKQRRPRVEGDK